MARYRKARRFRRRRIRRRRTRASKALTKVRALSRKMAGEVKKLDNNAIVPENSFTQLSSALGTSADYADSLPDYGYLYQVFDSAGVGQGYRLGDFVGEQIRAKYLYVGIHLQMPNRPADTTTSALSIQQPLCLRCMIVQDRNYNASLTLEQMVRQLFGVANVVTNNTSLSYLMKADYTLLPINPYEPGRFNVIRDFKMFVAPGFRMDYYKKVMLLQRDLLSGGRFYAGAVGTTTAGQAQAPTQVANVWSTMRNNVYVLFLFQSPTIYGANQAGAPDFTVSVQTRLAYYDN